MAMTSSRPHLLRALYDWILENSCTPYIVVDALQDGVQVPQEYVQAGQIVLNISPGAVRDLEIEAARLSFRGRFRGVPMEVETPIVAVTAIYAKENGRGMVFEDEPTDAGPGGAPKAGSGGSVPRLRVIK